MVTRTKETEIDAVKEKDAPLEGRNAVVPLEHTDAPEMVSGGRLVGFNLGDGEYEIAEQLTKLPIQQVHNKPFYVKFESEPYLAPKIEDAPKSKFGQPTIADVVNLETGEEQFVIFRTVLMNELQKWTAKTKTGLIGQAFAIRPQQKVDDDGSYYWTYVIFHLRQKRY